MSTPQTARLCAFRKSNTRQNSSLHNFCDPSILFGCVWLCMDTPGRVELGIAEGFLPKAPMAVMEPT